jgi:hypothetical protein
MFYILNPHFSPYFRPTFENCKFSIFAYFVGVSPLGNFDFPYILEVQKTGPKLALLALFVVLF